MTDEPCAAVEASVCDKCGSQMERQMNGRVYTEDKISYAVGCASGHTGVVHITTGGTAFDGDASGEEYLSSND